MSVNISYDQSITLDIQESVKVMRVSLGARDGWRNVYIHYPLGRTSQPHLDALGFSDLII